MWIVAPDARASRPWPGDVIGVVVGFEHVLDSDPVQPGKVQVRLDLPLRVDHRGDALVDVADQVGGASEILVDHLPKEHREPDIIPAIAACLRF